MATWCEEPTHWEKSWCWERLRAREEGSNRGWDSWIELPTQWAWAWANCWRWRRTRKPGMLQSMGSQRVRPLLVAEQQQNNIQSRTLLGPFINSVPLREILFSVTFAAGFISVWFSSLTNGGKFLLSQSQLIFAFSGGIFLLKPKICLSC